MQDTLVPYFIDFFKNLSVSADIVFLIVRADFIFSPFILLLLSSNVHLK